MSDYEKICSDIRKIMLSEILFLQKAIKDPEVLQSFTDHPRETLVWLSNILACGEISYDIYDCFYNDGRMMKHGMYVGQERTKIGEVVFLTKSEAEAKLKELRGNQNEV